MFTLKGKKALITGAGSGIGKCLAELMAQEGVILYLGDINEENLIKTCNDLKERGANPKYFVYDVSKQSEVKSVANTILQDGGLDILVNNAGIGYSNAITDTPVEVWQRLIEVNFLGPIYHIYAFLDKMKELRSGHIVNVSSGQAFFKLPGWGAYASIKAALGVFSEILHFELKRYGIKVTTVYPFMVNTPFYKDIKGETFGAKLSMKLVPYYSMKPESVAKIILNAIKKGKKIEKVSIFNEIGFYSQFVPLLPDVVAMTSTYLLTKKK